MDPESNGRPSEEELEADAAGGGGSLAGRLVGAGTDRARRMVGATGIDQALESAIEDAIVRAIESEAVERSMTRIINGPVIDNAVRDAMASPAVERSMSRIINGPLIENAVRDAMTSPAVEQALTEALDSEMIDRLWARILDSDETQRLIERIAEAPEVRAAIASQGLGLVDDLGRGIARVTRALDFILERIARRILFRKKRETPTDRVGLATRLLALGIDAIIVNVAVVSTTALLSFIAAAVDLDPGGLSGAAYAVGGLAWLAVGSLYLFVFWALSGQTPGMRFLDIRIEHEGQRVIGPKRAFRRLVGFWLAALPACLGFLGVLTRLDRRGFHDRLGQTMVYYINPAGPNQPHLAAVIDPMEESSPAAEPVDRPIAAEKPVGLP